MDSSKKLSEYDIRTVLSMTDLFPSLVDNGDGTFTNKVTPLSAIRAYSAVPSGGTTAQVLRKTNNTDYATEWHSLAKADVGLSNVDNTADTAKPVSSATTAAITAATQALYPVGSIYINASVSTNPGTLLGFGTWVAFGAGRVPVGKNTSGTFATAGATGGEETHVLTTTEMPSHRHYVRGDARSDSIGITYGGNGAGTTNMTPASAGANTSTYTGTLYGWYEGGDGAHNNLQPYVVVYMWQRTA